MMMKREKMKREKRKRETGRKKKGREGEKFLREIVCKYFINYLESY